MKRLYMIVVAIAIIILAWFLMGLSLDEEKLHRYDGISVPDTQIKED